MAKFTTSVRAPFVRATLVYPERPRIDASYGRTTPSENQNLAPQQILPLPFVPTPSENQNLASYGRTTPSENQNLAPQQILPLPFARLLLALSGSTHTIPWSTRQYAFGLHVTGSASSCYFSGYNYSWWGQRLTRRLDEGMRT